MTEINDILADREKTHGDFAIGAEIADDIIGKMEAVPIWKFLRPTQRIALQMIALKISRILGGNPENIDSWCDLAGYSQLIVRELEKNDA